MIDMSLDKKSTLIIIVALDKKPQQTLTYRTLCSTKYGQQLDIIFWSNKHKGQSFKKENLNFISSPQNLNLSQVYNNILNNNLNYVRYMIFDDDSNINEEYLESVIKSNSEICVPEVEVNENKVYPICIKSNRVVDSTVDGGFKSINSGICLSYKLIEKIKAEYGNVYDEKFSFYGTDFSLFYRLDKLGVKVVQQGKISHSLSRLESIYEPNCFRWRQKLYENILMWRNYPKYNSPTLIIKVIVKLFVYFDRKTFRKAVGVLIRNRADINE
ncbi:hypothetical protein [Vibrio breoganii]|uniref:hypothetical protein n=1 Tax=Vibrio breoganii TaxID=553239 RepID=UPI000C836617|nr:hypothetical protein [Vibrio breoganii]PML99984.1 hypothetical protein BCT64_18320 [Vibrio breoganii]PMN70144.1 hypothetical protein BCT28_18025 [Vibrio breoganii]